MILDSVTLTDQKPLVTSKTRYVFEHPGSDVLLIKVHIDRLAKTEKPGWFERRKDHFMYTTGIMRELQQYVELHAPGGHNESLKPFIAPVYGVIETDIGLGLLVAAIRDSEGGLAPTVRDLRRNRRLDNRRQQLLHQLLDTLESSSLVVGDLNEENIVLANAGGTDERFMIIDGLGDRTLIPTQRLIPSIGRYRKRDFVITMRRRLAELDDGR